MFYFIGNHITTEYSYDTRIRTAARSPIRCRKAAFGANRPGSDVHIFNFSYLSIIRNTNHESLIKA